MRGSGTQRGGQAPDPDYVAPRIGAGWLPALVLAILGILVAVLWSTLDQREQAHLRGRVQTEAQHLADRIDADLRDRIPTLQRMAHGWGARPQFTEAQFTEEARALLADVPGFQAIEWVDDACVVRWVAPLEGNERAVGLDLAVEPKRREALSKARESRQPAVTAPIDLVQGGKGFLVFVPVSTQNRPGGFVLGAFRIREWLNDVFATAPSIASGDFRIAATFDDVSVFEQPGWNAFEASAWNAAATTALLDHRVTVHVRPTWQFVEQNRTVLPAVTAALGGLLSVLVAFVVYVMQKASVEAWRSHAARAALEAELIEHGRTEEALERAVTRLDIATRAGGIGVWTWDVATGAMTWNEQMFEMFDVPPDVQPTYETWRAALHADDRPLTEQLLEHAVSGRGTFKTEFRVVLTSGDVRHLAAAARMERDQSGLARAATGVAWDVTARRLAEDQVRKSEEHVRLLLDSAAEGIYGIDLDGNCTFANRSCVSILGYRRVEDLLGRNMHWLIHHSHADGQRMDMETCSIYRAFREGARVQRDDEVLWRADGTSFPAEYWSYPQFADGQVSGAVVTFNDITRRRNADAALAAERRRLGYILEGTNVGTWEWNVQTGEATYNERWAEMVGYTRAELTPASIHTWLALAHPDDVAESQRRIERHFAGELPYYECEARMRHKDGSWVWILDRGKVATRTPDGRPLLMCGTHQDITERKRAEDEVRRLATHDSLTGLPSLKLAKDRLTMAIGHARRQDKRVALMFVDLDGFKSVNDTFGHQGGDELLREVARRMSSCVRTTDTVARVGGDEFLVIATDLRDAASAGAVAEKLVRIVSQPVAMGGRQAQVGASIGVALFPEDADGMDDLVRRADEAMYRVKARGKNGFLFCDSQAAAS